MSHRDQATQCRTKPRNGGQCDKLSSCQALSRGNACHAAHSAKTLRRMTMALKIERFQPEGMNVRMSAGQPSYSHVVTVSGTGKLVYTAGQLARDIDGNCVGKGDMRAQMEQTFQNLDRCLKAAGATWADVVKTNTFVTDFDEFQKCGDVRMRYLGQATPTSTTVGVTRLAGPDFMVEIELVAVLNG
jgi:2-iminobutanoate/2-iminopropanoate deaminase